MCLPHHYFLAQPCWSDWYTKRTNRYFSFTVKKKCLMQHRVFHMVTVLQILILIFTHQIRFPWNPVKKEKIMAHCEGYSHPVLQDRVIILISRCSFFVFEYRIGIFMSCLDLMNWWRFWLHWHFLTSVCGEKVSWFQTVPTLLISTFLKESMVCHICSRLPNWLPTFKDKPNKSWKNSRKFLGSKLNLNALFIFYPDHNILSVYLLL